MIHSVTYVESSESQSAVVPSSPSPSSSPPIPSNGVVKVESGFNEDEKKWPPKKSPVRFSAAEFLALWRATQSTHGTAGPHLGTLTIGSIVFAPCSVQGGLPTTRGFSHASLAPPPAYRLHYALAEVTGIQVMAGTVTLSFLFTDPGVDDEAISLYECIPCPPVCLARWLQEDEGTVGSSGTAEGVADTSSSPSYSSTASCSLLERVLHVAPEDSPLPVNSIYTALASSTARNGRRKASRLSSPQQRCAARLRELFCLSDNDSDEDDNNIGNVVQDGEECPKGSNTSGRKKAVEAKGTTPMSDVKVLDTKTVPQQPQQTGTAVTAAATVIADGDASPLFTWNSVADLSPPHSTAMGEKERRASPADTTMVLTARYRAPLTLHVFFARVFQKVDTYVEGQHRRLTSSSSAKAAASFHASPLWRRLPPHGSLPPRSPPVILVLFDSYVTLRRFHVYMTVRGHVVQLQDGTDDNGSGQDGSHAIHHTKQSTSATATASGLCQGGPPLPPRIPVAFGTDCKVWLCMLRDDTVEEDANADSESAAQMVAAQLARLLRAAPPIDALVSFREYEKGQQGDVGQKAVTAEQVLLSMLPHLSSARFVCSLQDVPTLPLRSAASSAAAANVVKVSGAIFGDRKLLVPCSPEQLTLLASVLAEEPLPPSSSPSTAEVHDASSTDARQKRATQKRPRSPDGALHALTPALLERIALGTFTDAAASALFDVFGDASAAVVAAAATPQPTSPNAITVTPTLEAVPQVAESALLRHGPPPTLLGSVEDVYEKWCVDPSRFGEAFPVFQAVYALVADVFQHPVHFRSAAEQLSGQPTFAADPSSLPRVALVLPRGNPTHHPSLSTQQFLHTLRLFFTPWTLHEVGPIAMSASASAATQPATTSASSSTVNTCVLWHQRGGLLLLFCDEPTTQLGALQDEADVVIACGKAAAAWVAANAAGNDRHRDTPTTSTAAVYFAVISEMEVVPSMEHGAHLWLPVSLCAPSLADMKREEKNGSALSVAAEDNGMALASAALRWPTTMGDMEELTRGQSEVLWERLLSTVGTDGNPLPFTSTRPAHQQDQPSALNGSSVSRPAPSSSSLPGRRPRHIDVLPKTLRQAVVLWRHLDETSKEAVHRIRQTGESGTPWRILRKLIKTIALSCATVTPIRMSDVVLVRRFDSATQ